jgi:putative DNA modification/repair radical SAM protein
VTGSTEEKIEKLGRQARFDVCGYPLILDESERRPGRFAPIYRAIGEGGRFVRLFKVLQSNQCRGNCFYCANRAGRDFERLCFRSDELARTFMEFYRKGLVDGLFLSSGIPKGPDESQLDMLETLRILRGDLEYRGYVHCKMIPGANPELIRKAAGLSDRMSINLEAPAAKYIARLSETKDYRELQRGIKTIARIHRESPLRSGIATQLVVGACGESDGEILSLAGGLYRTYGLSRVYYSAFTPLRDTPLEDAPPCPSLREARLYQADWLLRRYGFGPDELPLDREGNLPAEVDPKLAWAERHREAFPLEVNRASYAELLRVPGIGHRSARRICARRRESKITNPGDLRRMGVVLKRARAFITLSGRSCGGEAPPDSRPNRQLFLWEDL